MGEIPAQLRSYLISSSPYQRVKRRQAVMSGKTVVIWRRFDSQELGTGQALFFVAIMGNCSAFIRPCLFLSRGCVCRPSETSDSSGVFVGLGSGEASPRAGLFP